MAYTVTELITRAWYLSGIVSRDIETVDGDQLNDGLQMLNSLLSFKTANQRLIPYYKEYNFTAVIGQQKYFIPDLILCETLTFQLDTQRFSMLLTSRQRYFATCRANNINSLPYIYHLERTFGGSDLYMYYFPDQTYSFVLWGKFSLSDVVLNQDLSLTLDQFYIEYLRYALAEYMCQEYNIQYQPQNQSKLNEFERMIFDISPIDFTNRKISMFQKGSSLNYADYNIGKGYRPT
jgi:hypothetical protein